MRGVGGDLTVREKRGDARLIRYGDVSGSVRLPEPNTPTTWQTHVTGNGTGATCHVWSLDAMGYPTSVAQPCAGGLASPRMQRIPRRSGLIAHDQPAIFSPQRRRIILDQQHDAVAPIIITRGDAAARSRQVMVHDSLGCVKTAVAC